MLRNWNWVPWWNWEFHVSSETAIVWSNCCHWIPLEDWPRPGRVGMIGLGQLGQAVAWWKSCPTVSTCFLPAPVKTFPLCTFEYTMCEKCCWPTPSHTITINHHHHYHHFIYIIIIYIYIRKSRSRSRWPGACWMPCMQKTRKEQADATNGPCWLVAQVTGNLLRAGLAPVLYDVPQCSWELAAADDAVCDVCGCLKMLMVYVIWHEQAEVTDPAGNDGHLQNFFSQCLPRLPSMKEKGPQDLSLKRFSLLWLDGVGWGEGRIHCPALAGSGSCLGQFWSRSGGAMSLSSIPWPFRRHGLRGPGCEVMWFWLVCPDRRMCPQPWAWRARTSIQMASWRPMRGRGVVFSDGF